MPYEEVLDGSVLWNGMAFFGASSWGASLAQGRIVWNKGVLEQRNQPFPTFGGLSLFRELPEGLQWIVKIKKGL
eukprot:357322-Amphidinium_carterae.1